MGLSPHGALKVSLWLQAGSLLVLTSLLADSYAWIGATLTAIGLCFVTIGIGAAHKKSLGYLYCYATLIGFWTLLAILHVIIILSLISVSEDLVDPVLVVGEKIVDNGSDPLRIVVPALYGLQAAAWCTSLVCVVALRMAVVEDPTLGFEIQNPKRKSVGAHTLNSATGRSTAGGSKRSSRMSQRFFGLGQSMVAPYESATEISTGSMQQQQEKEKEYMRQHGEIQHQYHPQEQPSSSCNMQEPHVSWAKQDGTANTDGNVIFFPRGRRISQVVVTFRDDTVHDQHVDPTGQRQMPPTESVSPSANADIIEARTVFITSQNYGLGDLLFEKTGESLSDIIFKSVQPQEMAEKQHCDTFEALVSKDPVVRVSDESEHTDGDTKAGSPALSAVTTLDDMAVDEDKDNEDEGGYEHRAKVMDLALGYGANSNSKIEHTEHLLREQHQRRLGLELEEEEEEEEDAFPALATKPSPSFPYVPARRSSMNHLQRIGEDEDEEEEPDAEEFRKHDVYRRKVHFDVAPTMQPNSSDSHPFSDDQHSKKLPLQTYGTSAEPAETPAAPTPKPRSNLASLQYWKNKNNTNALTNSNNDDSSSGFSLSFSKKKKLTVSPPTTEAAPVLSFAIPTIVLHPDEEDDEPVRVLSETDIEYLSTMPAVPLRPLVQPWDEVEEDDYYYEDGNDGYDYDDYHNPRYSQDDGDEFERQEEERYRREQEYERNNYQDGQQRRPSIEGEFDPYALDVPINLEIDLQGLEQADMATAF